MGSKPIGISASRGAAICGVSKYATPLQVWLEILEQNTPGWCVDHGMSVPDNFGVDVWAEPLDPKHAAMRWGLWIEPGWRNFGKLIDCEKMYETEIGGAVITCHIDGALAGTPREIVENKTTTLDGWRARWGAPGTGEIPEEYVLQVHHQMICTGVDRVTVHLAIFPIAPAELEKSGAKVTPEKIIMPGDDKPMTPGDMIANLANLGLVQKYYVKKDNNLVDKMLIAYRDFAKCIENETPPRISKYHEIKWLIPAYAGEVEAGERARELWREYWDIANEIGDQQDRQGDIKAELAAEMVKRLPAKKAAKKKIELYAGRQKLASQTDRIFRISKPKR